MLKKVFFVSIGVIAFLITGSLIYLFVAYPSVGHAPDIVVEGTPEQIKRGRYLTNHVTVCIDCHSQRDWSRFSGPIVKGTEGKGGDRFDETMGFPGTFYARNITPHNLGNWTDGEIYRTITTGVSRDGSALFPVMPYRSYAQMDPEDVNSIIAYIRTLQPVDYVAPRSQANFPMNLLMRTMPQPASPQARPDSSNTIEYGKYLTTIAACGDCHTPAQQGTPIEGMHLAGGFEFQMPAGTVRSANLTPDLKTGLGNWTEEQFLARFRQYRVSPDSLAKVSPADFNTVMPWSMYAGMKEEDLKAIFAYLQSIKPVEHRVVRFSPHKQLTASQ